MRPVLAAALAAGALLATLAPAEEVRTISVTGRGEVAAVPDMAVLTLGVETEAPSAEGALSANTEAVHRVIGTVRERGIDDRDIQTSSLQVYPVYERRPQQTGPGPEGSVSGFRVSNQVTVRIRDLEMIGEALSASVEAGANRIGGLAFSVSDPAALMDEARRKAVADARKTAALLAEAAGAGLGPVRSISETAGHDPFPRDGMTMRAEAAMAVPIEAGESIIAASVSVVWDLSPAAE